MTFKYLLKASTLLVATMATAPTAMAQGVPVVDSAQIAQSASQSARELGELIKQFEQLQTQYAMLEQQFNAVSGLTDLSGFSSRDFRKLGSSIDMLDYALDSTRGTVGSIPTIAAKAMERRSLSLGFTDGMLLEFSGSDIPGRRILAERGSAGLVAAGLGENGYSVSNDLSEDAEKLRGELGQQETLKQSVDYNSALLNTLLQVQIETLRINSGTAMTVGTDAAVRAAEQARQTNFARGNN